MSLINCPDCGREVSRLARNCPGCGRPFSDSVPVHAVAKNSDRGGCLPMAIIAIVVLGGVSVLRSCNETEATGTTPGNTPPAATSPAAVQQKLLDGPVTMSATVDQQHRVIGTTNLPDATPLIISLHNRSRKYSGQSESVVNSGAFESKPFSESNRPLAPGSYEVQITTPMASLQPTSVRDIIGARGEKLTGPYVKDGIGGKSVVATFKVSIAGADNGVDDNAAAQQSTQEIEAWKMKSCLSKCSMLAKHAIKTAQPFDRPACEAKCPD